MSATEHPASVTNVRRIGLSRRASLGALAVIAVALLVVSVLQGSASLPFLGGAGAQSAITGSVRASGQFGVGPVRHAELAVTGTTAEGIRDVRHVLTDTRGHFALHLPPGRYTVRVIAPGDGLPAKSVTITRGHSKQLRFWFSGP
ncbi:MAG: carboxypeptidase-like regulatory domain-containing protein [Mycobacteriales bacterium]